MKDSHSSGSDVPINYFTCTLGEALHINAEKTPETRSLININDFVDYQADRRPHDLAVGFPVRQNADGEWGYELFNYEELQKGSMALAAELRHTLSPYSNLSSSKCVALLCPSSIDFLFAWLALMRAGSSVLLIAPQCQPAAIAHLCGTCDVTLLLHDKSYTDLASYVTLQPESTMVAKELPWQSRNVEIVSIIRGGNSNLDICFEYRATILDTAFIFHTSGTSTGLPKPIPQSHRAAFMVLPFLNGHDSATFTTTPLYHGGIADCFRAWTSGAMIWLFPGADTPITSQNILSCLAISSKCADTFCTPMVRYFSSVPYVLQMLAETPSGLSMLQSMDIVGVGGAALSPTLGNYLVQKGVHLISRFGSAECGFILSSHRDYETDTEWQYLRNSVRGNNLLSFEMEDDSSGLSELVILKDWPHIARSNRSDGSFATSDLFEPHPTIRDAWMYHSRKDGQITLTTGKKFDPAPLEETIRSSSALIEEALVFGTGRQIPGVLVFPSKNTTCMTSSELEEEIWEIIKNINLENQVHTRISREMLSVMAAGLPTLEKSSKGTIQRSVAEKRFFNHIDILYRKCGNEGEKGVSNQTINNDDMNFLVKDIIKEVLGGDMALNDDADFYKSGVDSVACTQIRNFLQKKLVRGQKSLPWNIVYDCGNIKSLSQYLLDLRNGNSKKQSNEEQEMFNLVDKYSKFSPTEQTCSLKIEAKCACPVVLLTGATGSLGSHILEILRQDFRQCQVICLVRAPDRKEARARISASLVQRRKTPLEEYEHQIKCLPFRLGDPGFGLPEEELSYIRGMTTHVIHAAWAVNFSLPLRSYIDEHIAGLQNLFNLILSCSNNPRMFFCSSTASILGSSPGTVIEEKISTSPTDADTLGYSRSKWVAEAICLAAAKATQGKSAVSVLRIGQLTGDTQHGVWNMSEAWPQMLSTVEALDCLPQIQESLNWLPVDVAARAVVEIAFHSGESREMCPVYHIVNNSSETNWSDLLSWIGKIRLKPFSIVSPVTWLVKLEGLDGHPALNLLGLWKKAYGGDTDGSGIQARGRASFSVDHARKESATMRRDLGKVDERLVRKVWVWLESEL